MVVLKWSVCINQTMLKLPVMKTNPNSYNYHVPLLCCLFICCTERHTATLGIVMKVFLSVQKECDVCIPLIN